MANSTDPFGKSVFGGQTSIPGQTSMATPAAAAAGPAKYQYLNKGWEDPLAQEIAKKYMHDPNARTTMWNPAGADDEYRQLKELSDAYHRGGSSGGGYQDPLNPTNWRSSGIYTGDQAAKMKEEYVNRGGLGTYEQLAFTNPKDVGAPYQQATGGPAATMNMSTGQMETPTWDSVQKGLGYKGTLTPTTPVAGGTGSSNTLSSDVLSKMWR